MTGHHRLHIGFEIFYLACAAPIAVFAVLANFDILPPLDPYVVMILALWLVVGLIGELVRKVKSERQCINEQEEA